MVITGTTRNRLAGDEPARGFESHRLRHGVASFISLAALSSCFAFEIAASLIPLLRLLREKARLLRLLACKRARDGSAALPPFRGFRLRRKYFLRVFTASLFL